ncbi:MAG: DUF2130 domain-containing protein [Lachnospiraceae bacterium]|nr:DUF2130 domain-containing protein [Lachnospiraceae bacterium]
MTELKCPHCGQVFTVDENELDSIVNQIRDSEFKQDVNAKVAEAVEHLKKEHQLELDSKDKEMRLELQMKEADTAAKYKDMADKEIRDLEGKLRGAEEERDRLKMEIENIRSRNEAEVLKAVQGEKEKVASLESDKKLLELAVKNEEEKGKTKVLEAVQKANEEIRTLELAISSEKERNKILLEEKDKQIEFYKDMKTKMSTKMVGESLEQHCQIQFEQLRATAFRNAYFEKDNDAKSGSKGDFIYRENDENGNEIVSIMFEMKNEMDTTSTKHKNEDFLKELDKDRREKSCEYAVLVSLLEADSEIYNAGIVDVSHKFEKMYVVRPQCFIPIITLLRNAAMNAMTYKRELVKAQNQNIDITNFESSLLKFKEEFGRNYGIAHDHFQKAIEEIDKTIDHLEKVKKELLGSDNQLRLANNKVDDVSIKKLTKNNPTMQKKFEELKNMSSE